MMGCSSAACTGVLPCTGVHTCMMCVVLLFRLEDSIAWPADDLASMQVCVHKFGARHAPAGSTYVVFLRACGWCLRCAYAVQGICLLQAGAALVCSLSVMLSACIAAPCLPRQCSARQKQLLRCCSIGRAVSCRTVESRCFTNTHTLSVNVTSAMECA